MSEQLANGSIYSVAASYAAPIALTALSNASQAVGTFATGPTLAAGDIVEVTSGWGGLNNRVVRVASATTTSLTLENIDTTSTLRFPAGSGVGSVRKILTWVQIAQIVDAAGSGGEQQYVQWVYLEDGIQRQKKTYKNARSLKLTMNDDSNLPFYPVLRTADDDGLNRAVRLILPSTDVLYYNMDVSFNDEPQTNSNDLLKVECTLSQAAKFIRYHA